MKDRKSCSNISVIIERKSWEDYENVQDIAVGKISNLIQINSTKCK